MKALATVIEYEKPGRAGSDLAPYLRRVVDGMPVSAQQVLDESRGRYCAGEIALYDELTQGGLNPVVAARAAVLFPDPLKFHPHAIAGIGLDAQNTFREERDKGVGTLAALVTAARVARPYIVSGSEYRERLEKLAEFVAAQK